MTLAARAASASAADLQTALERLVALGLQGGGIVLLLLLRDVGGAGLTMADRRVSRRLSRVGLGRRRLLLGPGRLGGRAGREHQADRREDDFPKSHAACRHGSPPSHARTGSPKRYTNARIAKHR